MQDQLHREPLPQLLCSVGTRFHRRLDEANRVFVSKYCFVNSRGSVWRNSGHAVLVVRGKPPNASRLGLQGFMNHVSSYGAANRLESLRS